MKAFVLHTGVPKTASSTLQQAVFESHGEIYYLGKFLSSKLPKRCRSQEIFDVLEPVIWRRETIGDWERLRARFESLIIEQAMPEQVVVASWESLGSQATVRYCSMIERLQRLSGSFRILICLRNPLTWVTSQYLQHVKGHYYRNKRETLFVGNPGLTFSQWAEQNVGRRGGVAEWLSQSQNARAAVAKLGRENAGVFLFEQLIKDPVQYFSAISAFLQINSDETLRLAAGVHRNPSLSEAQLEFIRQVHSSPARRQLWEASDSQSRKRAMDKATRAQDHSPSAHIQLPGEWRDRISVATRESNAWLQDELGLPVREFGYPL